MNLKKSFHVDATKAEEGVWFPYEDAEFLVARIRNPKYRKCIENLTRKYKRQMELGTLKQEVAEEIVTKAMADTILNGWRGNVAFDDEGTPLPYSRENAYKVLSEFPDFRDLISNWSSDMEAFQIQEKDEDIKNSDSLSSGTSDITKTRIASDALSSS